jgi:ATP-dependent RNA/DNA helicase IGHMBP2
MLMPENIFTQQLDAELRNVRNLLKQEWDEDRRQYMAKISADSFAERREAGICWYPIRVMSHTFDGGECLRVLVGRSPEHNHRHSMQSGRPVVFFSQLSEEYRVQGVVNYCKESEMAISLNVDEIPDWFDDGKLGVQLLFDETSYRSMDEAMKEVCSPSHPRLKELVEVIYGIRTARFSEREAFTYHALNTSQNNAASCIASAQDISIIHGPPGTGKTTALVQSVLRTLRDERQVLVCAPSNTAVDLLVDKLAAEGADVVRLGHPARITEDMLCHTLDAKTARHIHFQELKSLRKRAEEIHKQAGKYKRQFGQRERDERRMLQKEARSLRSEAEHLAFYITSDIISASQVIACTLTGAASLIMRGRRFGTVFIDEAAQALEPACWIPIIKAQRVIMAGDHKQLPPTVKSEKAARAGLSRTLFEKAAELSGTANLLVEQYRMNAAIMKFSSSQMYGGKLFANESVADWLVFPGDLPVEFIDTAGCGFDEKQDPETLSFSNPDEAKIVYEHALAYFADMASHSAASFESAAAVSPYRGQVAELAAIFEDTSFLAGGKFSVATIDSFQGQERDVVYISLTRSNSRGEIGFLADTRRMNVAITRAKKKLVVIGDSSTVCSNPFYDAFVEYASSIGGYRSAYEFFYK